MRERNQIASAMDGVLKLEAEVSDALELIELAEADGDAAMAAEAMAALRAAAAEAKRREIESLLSGEADANDCYIELNSGAGGTEAQDWAEMLMRMYMRWAEQHGYKVQLIEESEGEQAGIKSATLQISGPNAYGWLKTEAGVHRLVRISPFDANARRQTSFASVWVYPVVDDSIDIEINEADLKVDTYRASGAGGQHVEQDGKRDPDHPPSERDYCRVPDGPEPAPEPGDGDGDAEGPDVRGGVAAAGGDHRSAGGREDRYRLGASDSQLCTGAVSVGEGPADRGGEGEPRRGARRRPGRVHGGGASGRSGATRSEASANAR